MSTIEPLIEDAESPATIEEAVETTPPGSTDEENKRRLNFKNYLNLITYILNITLVYGVGNARWLGVFKRAPCSQHQTNFQRAPCSQQQANFRYSKVALPPLTCTLPSLTLPLCHTRLRAAISFDPAGCSIPSRQVVLITPLPLDVQPPPPASHLHLFLRRNREYQVCGGSGRGNGISSQQGQWRGQGMVQRKWSP
jgi:hypothetical protein